MTTPLPKDVQSQVFEALRLGTVPDDGLEAFAELDPAISGALVELLAAPNTAGGAARLIRGDFGTGKTFAMKLASARARELGFVTTYVVLDEAQLPLSSPERLYRALLANLRCGSAPRAGLLHLVDQWTLLHEVDLRKADGNAPASVNAHVTANVSEEALVAACEQDLVRRGIGASRPDLRTALLGVVRARNRLDHETAWGLTSWLAGSDNVAPHIVRAAGLRGQMKVDDVEPTLLDLTRLVVAAGYRGTLFAIDELAAVLRCDREQRERGWEMVLKIVDDWRRWPNTVFLLAGTDEIFVSPRGIAGFEPLRQRVQHVSLDGTSSARQAQLVLPPLDAERLAAVAGRLIDLYPARNPERLAGLKNADERARLCGRVQAQSGGNPRAYLRQLCDVLDFMDQGAPLPPEPGSTAGAGPGSGSGSGAGPGATSGPGLPFVPVKF